MFNHVKENFSKNLKKYKSFKIWILLLIVSFIGLLLFHIVQFSPSLLEPSVNYPRPFSQDSVYIYFYFTFQSNFLAFIISLINVLGFLRRDCVHTNRIKTLTFVSLKITMLVFWLYLFPDKITKGNSYTILTFTTTLFLHTFVPLIYMIVYIYEIKKEKLKLNLNLKKDLILVSIYPFAWLIFATIIYFIYGGNHKDAIYPFLRFKTQPLWVSIIFPIVIGGLYIGISFLTIYFLTKKTKIIKK